MGAARGLASGIQSNPILKAANGLTGGQIGAGLTVLGGGNPLKGTPFDPKNPLGANGALDPSGAFKQPGPQAADIQNPLAPDTLSKGQASIDSAMGGQQGLLAALAGQGALGAQSNALSGLEGQAAATTGANGVGVQQGALGRLGDVYNNQGNTVGQLQDIANGVGPNPAQALLRQQTGQNVANQAALMAGQRGAGANIGLMARQNALQGGNLQQQAVGQGATLQANQSLNALGQIGGQQAAMGNTAGAIGGLGTSQVGAAQTALGAQAGQANTMAGQQIGQTNQNATTAVANQGQNLGAAGNFTQAKVGSQASVNAANAAQAVQGQKAKADILGGAMNGLGAAGIAAMAGGGPVGGFDMTAPQNLQGPGPVTAPPVVDSPTVQFASGNMGMADYLKPDPTSGMSDWGSFISNLQKPIDPNQSELKQGSTQMGKIAGAGIAKAFMASGGLSAQGGHVRASSPGQKAKVSGNSYANDKVPAMLSEGEIVIPRSVLQSGDPVRGAADFVSKVLAKKGRK